MSISQKSNVAYSFNQPLSGIFPAPIVAKRAPLTTDKAQVGTVWVFKTSNLAWILTSVINNVATWVSIANAAPSFNSLTVTGGNVQITQAGAGIVLPGPVKIISGAGAPAGGLATEIGDIYINTTAASATTRAYIATAVGTWTNFTCAA